MSPKPSKRAHDPCTVATYVREMLQIAAQNRVYRMANLYRDLELSLTRLSTTSSMLQRACRLGYQGASDRLLARIEHRGRDLYRELGDVVNQPGQDPWVPSVPELCGELLQIEQEFGGWQYKTRPRTICVKTGPIHLENVYLGPFEIELLVPELSRFAGIQAGVGQHPFQVLALDPHPAAGSQHVTHPHVSDDRLCTGESSFLVSSALMEGRLADFFLMVRGLLQTYNPNSPYVPLDVWSGTTCNECGERVHEDDRYYCENCDHDVCDGCMGRCSNCEDSACLGCLINCPQCEEYSCKLCMKQCTECGEKCCVGCLEEELCPACFEAKENICEQTENTTEHTKTSGQETAVEMAPVHTQTT